MEWITSKQDGLSRPLFCFGIPSEGYQRRTGSIVTIEVMELRQEQIEEFKRIHEPYGGLGDYTEAEIREIANGVANYYLTLFRIYQRIKRDEREANESRETAN